MLTLFMHNACTTQEYNFATKMTESAMLAYKTMHSYNLDWARHPSWSVICHKSGSAAYFCKIEINLLLMQKKANLQTKEILVFCIMSCDRLYAFPIFCVIFSGRMIPHYGLSCAYGNTFRAGAKVLTIVQGQQRSTVSDAGDGKKVETAVVDPQDNTVSAKLRMYCSEVKLLDYKLDRNLAVVMVAGMTTEAEGDTFFEVDYIRLLKKEDLAPVLAAWEHLDKQCLEKQMVSALEKH